MGNADDYRKQAEDARSKAATAINPIDQATWMRLSEDWLRLAQEADRRASKRFEGRDRAG
jgi:hypothetical protein